MITVSRVRTTEGWGVVDGDAIRLDDGRTIAEADAEYLAPVQPSKIVAVHLTYQSRLTEYAARTPNEPSYFLKPPSALNGHRRPIVRPKGTSFLNYEGELAVVIGDRMKGVAIDLVLDHVAGYAPANDVGLHDFRHADRGSMFRVKGQDGFLPIGPQITPATEFDPTDFTLRTRRNGEVVQEATADDMVWGVAYQLADICRLITLEPGDVVSVEIDGLGAVENPVVESDHEIAGPGELPQTSAQTLHVALTIPEDEAERMIEQGAETA